MPVRIFVLLTSFSLGCGAAQPIVVTPAPAAAACAEPPGRRPAPAAERPAGHVAMTAQRVVPTVQGAALLLQDPTGRQIVPVFIGPSEAHVITLRLEGRTFSRPLTHDLMDRIIDALDGEIIMVRVNKLRGGVFVGSVFVWDGHRTHRIDSRTSDAVAIAVGHRVPIYVSEAVIAETGVPADQFAPGRI